MPTQLYGGSHDDFADSMAEEIEIALGEALVEAGLEPLPAAEDGEDKKRRRVFMIAIARGVIRHLEKKEQAFRVKVEDHPSTFPDIQVKSP